MKFYEDPVYIKMCDKAEDIRDSTSTNSSRAIWLAFVMKEKYSKTWDGDRWIS